MTDWFAAECLAVTIEGCSTHFDPRRPTARGDPCVPALRQGAPRRVSSPLLLCATAHGWGPSAAMQSNMGLALGAEGRDEEALTAYK